MKAKTIAGTAALALAAVAFVVPAGHAAKTVKTLHPGKRDSASSNQQNAYSGRLNGRAVKANLH